MCLQKLPGVGSGGRLVEINVGNDRRADKQRALVRVEIALGGLKLGLGLLDVRRVRRLSPDLPA
jgi:hypothetical protein